MSELTILTGLEQLCLSKLGLQTIPIPNKDFCRSRGVFSDLFALQTFPWRMYDIANGKTYLVNANY